MKAVPFGLLLLATLIHAQMASDTGTVPRITSELLHLNSVLISSEPLKDEIYTPAELQSLVTWSQHKIMQAYQRDLLELQIKRNRAVSRPGDASLAFGSFYSADQAYRLSSPLAGKDLSERSVTLLAEGIVAMAEAAIECRYTSSSLQTSAGFRNAAEKVWTALQVLGVGDPDRGVVVDALFRGAVAAASPPVRTTYK